MRILYITTSNIGDAGPHFEMAHEAARFNAPQLLLQSLFQALRDGDDEVVYVHLKAKTEQPERNKARLKEDQTDEIPSGMSAARKWLTQTLYGMAPGVKTLLYDNLITLRRHLRAIDDARADVVVGRDASSTATCILARLRGIPCIVHMDGLWEAEARFGRKNTVDYRLIAWLFGKLLKACGTRFAVVSKAVQDYLVEKGFRPESITVLENGVDAQRFHPAVARHPIAQSLSGRVVVGFVGSFSPWHRIDEFLESIPTLIQSNPTIVFVFVGAGPEWDRVNALANDAKISSNVVMLGSVPHEEVPSIVACFDIGVIPFTVYSCSPMKIYEYMAMAKATVAPRWPSVEAIIDHDVDGYLFEPDDMEALQSHILRLADDPELRQRVGRRARSKMLEQFGWSRCAGRFRSACTAAMNGRP